VLFDLGFDFGPAQLQRNAPTGADTGKVYRGVKFFPIPLVRASSYRIHPSPVLNRRERLFRKWLKPWWVLPGYNLRRAAEDQRAGTRRPTFDTFSLNLPQSPRLFNGSRAATGSAHSERAGLVHGGDVIDLDGFKER